MAWAERLGNFIWNPWLLGLFLLCGLYISVRTGFFQVFRAPLWLKTTLGSLLRREKRRAGLSMTVSLDDEEEARQAELPDERYSPHRQAEQRELRDTLRAGLAAMTEEHRQVLVLRELEGLSYGEIASLLGVEEGTVKSRIARARLALRNYLTKQGNFFGETPSKG